MLRPQAVSRQIATAVATALGDERRSAGVDRALTVRTTRDANVAVRASTTARRNDRKLQTVYFSTMSISAATLVSVGSVASDG